MSSMLIPKERQTAYERWEMTSFSEGNATVVVSKPTIKEDEVSKDKITEIFETVRK